MRYMIFLLCLMMPFSVRADGYYFIDDMVLPDGGVTFINNTEVRDSFEVKEKIISGGKISIYEIVEAFEDDMFCEAEVFIIYNKALEMYNAYVINKEKLPHSITADYIVYNFQPVSLKTARRLLTRLEFRRRNYGFNPK